MDRRLENIIWRGDRFLNCFSESGIMVDLYARWRKCSLNDYGRVKHRRKRYGRFFSFFGELGGDGNIVGKDCLLSDL